MEDLVAVRAQMRALAEMRRSPAKKASPLEENPSRPTASKTTGPVATNCVVNGPQLVSVAAPTAVPMRDSKKVVGTEGRREAE
eukprot:gene75-200_t